MFVNEILNAFSWPTLSLPSTHVATIKAALIVAGVCVVVIFFVSLALFVLVMLNNAIKHQGRPIRPSIRALEASRRAIERRPREWGDD